MLYQKIDKNTAGYEKIRAELMALQSRINIILGIEGIKDWRITEKENLMHHFFPDEQLDNNQKVLLIARCPTFLHLQLKAIDM